MTSAAPDLKAIFGQAAEIESPAERSAYLDEACGQDTALRGKVERLLAASELAGSFMQGPAIAHSDTDLFPPLLEHAGTLIGPYKLLQQIGEGGMGVVFMAEQAEPIQRKVALKIIKPGMDTRQVIARFEAERQALALMDHPNIAKVLDAGTTGAGRPYFVMELVKGVPITKYCDEKRLPLRKRLELFLPVCQAVQHAHQKGIIHRDLKPTNVLVAEYDDHAIPKIIDFGVAKATAQKLTEHTMFTEFGQIIGTVEYMSPEQAKFNQLDIDTRSDIYSLGVLLYELLAGSPPFEGKRLREAAFDEVLRIIREEDPPKPSRRVSSLSSREPAIDSLSLAGKVGEGVHSSLASIAANRHTEPARLSKEVQGELDWIVMRSLEKDRQRRYQTANALADDLGRYLTDQPVEACPPSTTYWLKKLIRRNKGAVLAGSTVAAALVIGLILASIGFVRARTEAVRSEQVAQFLKDMLATAGPGVARGRDVKLLREIMNQTAERVGKGLQDQPEVQGDLWFTLGGTFKDIGDHKRAAEMFQQAVDSYRLALGDNSAQLALALAHLGECHNFMGNFSSGNANCNLGLGMARKYGDAKTLATCLEAAASSFAYVGTDSLESAPLLREAFTIRKQQLDDPLALADCTRALANSIIGDDIAEAETLARETLALHRQHLETNHPKVVDDMFLLGQVLLVRNKGEEATTVLRETLDLYSTVYDRNHFNRRKVLGALAFALDMQGNPDQAIKLLRDDSHGENDARTDELIGFHIGILLFKNGRENEYRQHCHEFLERATVTRSITHADLAAKLALLLPVNGSDFEQACQLADFASTATDAWIVPWAHLVKALAEYRRGNFDSARDWAHRAITADQVASQCETCAWFIEASACARLGQLDAAQAALSAGTKLASQRRSNLAFGFRMSDWIIAEHFRREAAKLLGITELQPPAEKPAARDQTPKATKPKSNSAPNSKT